MVVQACQEERSLPLVRRSIVNAPRIVGETNRGSARELARAVDVSHCLKLYSWTSKRSKAHMPIDPEHISISPQQMHYYPLITKKFLQV